MKRPLIIDCDPGLDDAIAILMALSADCFDIKAITTVAGNQTLDKTSNNALNLVDYAGFDIPVSMGASKPLLREQVTAEFVHGKTGLGDIVLPQSKRSFSEKNAYDTIYSEANKAGGKLLIVALGPLTNIATALLKYPDLKDKIEQLILMGGSCGCGNDTPAAEFNIYADPDAAKVVFESGLPIVMVGLDATHKALVYPEEFADIASCKNKASDIVDKILCYSIKFYQAYEYDGVIMHDPLAMAYAIDPNVMKTENYHVDIETKGTFTLGKTVVDIFGVTGKNPNVSVGIDTDRERFLNLLKDVLRKYKA